MDSEAADMASAIIGPVSSAGTDDGLGWYGGGGVAGWRGIDYTITKREMSGQVREMRRNRDRERRCCAVVAQNKYMQISGFRVTYPNAATQKKKKNIVWQGLLNRL
jgi:hypothetical protein